LPFQPRRHTANTAPRSYSNQSSTEQFGARRDPVTLTALRRGALTQLIAGWIAATVERCEPDNLQCPAHAADGERRLTRCRHESQITLNSESAVERTWVVTELALTSPYLVLIDGLETGTLQISSLESFRTAMCRSGSITDLSRETPLAIIVTMAPSSSLKFTPDGSTRLWLSLISK
jgi:hypothetical protein